MNKRPLELAKPQLKILLTIVVGLLPLDSAKSDTFAGEEQALVDRGAVMEMYKPDEHSRHFIAHIDSATDPKTGETRKIPKKSQAVVCSVFGIEDARSAREQGRSMAQYHYSLAQLTNSFLPKGGTSTTTDFLPGVMFRRVRTRTIKLQKRPAASSRPLVS